MIAHCAYGGPDMVMVEIGRSSYADFYRTRPPVRYDRVNFSLRAGAPA